MSSRSPSDLVFGAAAAGSGAASAAFRRSMVPCASQAAAASAAAPMRKGTKGRPGMKAKTAIRSATVESATG